jgi:hypothetical protein
MVRFVAIVFLLPFVTTAVHTQQTLPDEEALFDSVRENMGRANREQHRYAYKERRTEVHTNPFGRLGTGDVVLYDVTPGAEPSITYRKLLEKNGKPVANTKVEKQERRIRQGPSSVDDTVATLKFVIDRREMFDGRNAVVVRFAPRPDANPQTREGKLAKSFSGLIWIDEAAKEVMRVEAIAVEDMSYGLGFVARLKKGSVVTLKRERIDQHIWLPTSIKFKATGRALLVRSLNIDFAVDWFDYRRTGDSE